MTYETYFHLALLFIFTQGRLFILSNIACETSTFEDAGQRSSVENFASSLLKIVVRI